MFYRIGVCHLNISFFLNIVTKHNRPEEDAGTKMCARVVTDLKMHALMHEALSLPQSK